MKVAIRVDSSSIIGSGHIHRCLNIAKCLRKQNIDVSFITRNLSGNFNSLLDLYGFKVFLLELAESNSQPTRNVFDNVDDFGDYVETTWKYDADETAFLINKNGFNILIVDHYYLDSRYEMHASLGLAGVVVIDDLANRDHFCNILIDANWFGARTKDRYSKLLPSSCKQLLGPQYALLSDDYKISRDSRFKGLRTVKSILIFFGGSDSTNQTFRVLRLLSSNNLHHIHFDVVIGASNMNAKDIEEYSKKFNNITTYKNLPTLSNLMSKADLAIGAGGTSTWERACIGLPSIVIAVAKNQIEISQSLSDESLIHYLGWHEDVDDKDIISAVIFAINNPHMLKEKSDMLRKFVSYKGVVNVCKYIKNLKGKKYE